MPYRLTNAQAANCHLRSVRLTASLFCGLLLMILATTALAQERKPSTCLAVAENETAPFLRHASAQAGKLVLAQADKYAVNIRYITHSTYRIESPGGVVIATDYSGRAGSGKTPDIVTMNHAHGTHFTLFPEPEISHVLQGWGEQGGRIEHYLEVGDVLVRNVSTDIYRGGMLIEAEGNSIFIFEIEGLCIGHVGHLHHTLTPEHFAAIGRLDVLMVPVDGSMTMSIEGMSMLVRQFRSSLILPMHWFSGFSLQRFVQNVSADFAVEWHDKPSLDVSLSSLPGTPTVVVMQPEEGTALDFGD